MRIVLHDLLRDLLLGLRKIQLHEEAARLTDGTGRHLIYGVPGDLHGQALGPETLPAALLAPLVGHVAFHPDAYVQGLGLPVASAEVRDDALEGAHKF